ncbi:hypothetical protein HPA05_09045 [Streptococcus suis]|nr:hypothetical protein [Streptococcus suis]
MDNLENSLFVDKGYGIPSIVAGNMHLTAVLRYLSNKPSNMTATGLRHAYASTLLAMRIDIWAIAKKSDTKPYKKIIK